MGNIWLNENVDINKKIVRLCGELGDGAFRYLVRLWFYATKYAVDNLLDENAAGILQDFDDFDVELNAGWPGERGKFVEALTRLKLLDKKKGQYYIHDYVDNNTHIITLINQKINGSRYAKLRHEGKKKRIKLDDDDHTPEGTPQGDPEAKEKKVKEKKKTIVDEIAETAERILKDFIQVSGVNIRIPKKPIQIIKLRLKEGYEEKDFRRVTRTCTSLWKDDAKMRKYLHPTTIFNGDMDKRLTWSADEDRGDRAEKAESFKASLPTQTMIDGGYVNRDDLFKMFEGADKEERKRLSELVKIQKQKNKERRV